MEKAVIAHEMEILLAAALQEAHDQHERYMYQAKSNMKTTREGFFRQPKELAASYNIHLFLVRLHRLGEEVKKYDQESS